MGIALSPRLLTRVLRSLATLSKRLGGICGRAADPGSVHGDQTHTELVERLTTDGHQPPLAAPGDEERRSAVGWTILGVGKDATVRKRDLALHPRGGVEAQHSDDATDARCRGGGLSERVRGRSAPVCRPSAHRRPSQSRGRPRRWQIKQASGFVRGTWFGNDAVGHGLFMFETDGTLEEIHFTQSPHMICCRRSRPRLRGSRESHTARRAPALSWCAIAGVGATHERSLDRFG